MPREEKKYHFIYKTTNLLSGKYYIGMHSTDNLDDGYLGSGRRLRYSINKHGAENHEREILEFVNSREELKKREEEIVSLNEIAKEDCMNLKVGGEGGFVSLNAVRKGREKANEILKERYGDNFSKVIITNFHQNMNEKEKEEWISKIIKGQRDYNYITFQGKKHTEKTKKLMSKAKKGKVSGKNNSQYGTCWITKDGVNKKIKKEELDSFIQKGWMKGRKV